MTKEYNRDMGNNRKILLKNHLEAVSVNPFPRCFPEQAQPLNGFFELWMIKEKRK